MTFKISTQNRLQDESIYGYVESKYYINSGCYDIEISIVESYRCKDNSLYPTDKKIKFNSVNVSDAKNLRIGSYVAIYIKQDGSKILRVYEENKKLKTLNHKPFSDTMLISLSEKYNIVFIGSSIGYGDVIKEHRLARIIDLSPTTLEKYKLIESLKKVEKLQADGVQVDILAIGVGGTQTHQMFNDQQVIYHFNRIPNVTKYVGLGHFNTVKSEIRNFATESFRSPTEMGLALDKNLNSALEKLMPVIIPAPITPAIQHNNTINNSTTVHHNEIKSDNKKIKIGVVAALILASIAIGLVIYDKSTPAMAISTLPNESTVSQSPNSSTITSKNKHKVKKIRKQTKKKSSSTPSQSPVQPQNNVEPATPVDSSFQLN